MNLSRKLAKVVGPTLLTCLFAVLCLAGSSAQDAFHRARLAIAANDFQTAVSELSLSVREMPNKAEYQCTYALALSQTGEVTKARVALNNCLKLEPDYPSKDFIEGEIEAADKNYGKAVQLLQKAHKKDPQNVTVLCSLGLALAADGRYPDASHQFLAATRLRPDYSAAYYNLGLAYLNLGKGDKAETAFRQVLKLSPEDETEAHIQLANSLLMQARADVSGKMSEAAEAYREVLKKRPNNPTLHFNMAYILSKMGKPKAAALEYEEVLKLEPEYPSAQYYLGFTLYQLGDFAGAEKRFRQALLQGDNNFGVHYYLGIILLQSGNTKESERQLESAVHLDPENPSAHFVLSTVYRSLGNAQRAMAESRKFQELKAQSEEKYQNGRLQVIAQDALSRGKLKIAIDALNKLYKAHPSTALARNLALAYLQDGNLAQARVFLQEALKLSPKDPASLDYLGLLDAQEGNISKALTRFQEAARLDPTLVDALYNSGLAAARLGQTSLAIKYLRAALEKSDTAVIREALGSALAEAGQNAEAEQQFRIAEKLRKQGKIKP